VTQGAPLLRWEADTSGETATELSKFNEGKLEEYKRLSAQATEIVRTKDSEAAMEQAANLADRSAEVLAIVS
jgi:hypothetical protein